MCRRAKTCGLAVGIAAIVCLVLIYFLGMREEETAQAYQTDGGYFTSTPTVHVSVFESDLSILQQFGGGEVIFSGGKGFVRFQVREDWEHRGVSSRLSITSVSLTRYMGEVLYPRQIQIPQYPDRQP